jgi:hypothetical protein
MTPDPKTLTAFSKKAEGEIARNLFAATTGGLANISASTFWELYYAAQAWHEHQKQQGELQRVTYGQNVGVTEQGNAVALKSDEMPPEMARQMRKVP